jgi:NAD-dependent dihydropyrimidine dehydrogenase PreA subunit
MLLDKAQCTGCGRCVDVCPAGAIHAVGRTNKFRIDQDMCVECGTCSRFGTCPEPGALVRPKLRWPRTVRSLFSDPVIVHSGTDVPGRGTEEMKTNDVTGRLGPGQIGVSIDMGRPGMTATFVDIQRVAAVCAGAGARFEPRNPLTGLFVDARRGTFVPGVMKERVLSAIIEVEIERGRLGALLSSLRRVAGKVDTVFSVGVCFLAGPGSTPRALMKELRTQGMHPLPNGKINVGLGRPPCLPPSREKA